MVSFTEKYIGVPRTYYGVLEGKFGVRVFFSKTAGVTKALQDIKEHLSPMEMVVMKDLIEKAENIPEKGETPDIDDMVGEELPPQYFM